ncbi:hypothetical protein PMIN04_011631 [Paraphaeosphaeria minitans]
MCVAAQTNDEIYSAPNRRMQRLACTSNSDTDAQSDAVQYSQCVVDEQGCSSFGDYIHAQLLFPPAAYTILIHYPWLSKNNVVVMDDRMTQSARPSRFVARTPRIFSSQLSE